MGSIEYDVELSDEERSVQEMVHRFAEAVLRPAGAELDAMPDPQDVIAEGSVLWDVFEKHRALGLAEITAPGGDLPPRQQARLRGIISEELGWGDSGLAISFGVDGFPRMLAQISQNPELIERFGAADCIGCWAGTEPDHGSDTLFFGMKQGVEAPGKPNCIARKDGDSFVINGQKAAWVSNGTIATAAALFTAALLMTLDAAWVPAKAGLGQVLLERAWRAHATGAQARAPRPWPWACSGPVAAWA